ncbi:rRNA maturation RNase YbeY [bacterium]|nr:rRNA maturation RNase YbeY [bacterium]
MEILIANRQRKKRIDLKKVRRIVEAVLSAEDAENGRVSIVLANDKFIKELNAKYRGVDEPTDVLAFGFEEEEDLGEIIISVPTCLKQAIEYGHSFEEELALLLVHGVLHLLSYDHLEDDEAKIMQERERKILAMLVEG